MSSPKMRLYQMRKNGEIILAGARTTPNAFDLRPGGPEKSLLVQDAWRRTGGLSRSASKKSSLRVRSNDLADYLERTLKQGDRYAVVTWAHDNPAALGDKAGVVSGPGREVKSFVLALMAVGVEEIIVMDEESSGFLLLDNDEGRTAAVVSVTSYVLQE